MQHIMEHVRYILDHLWLSTKHRNSAPICQNNVLLSISSLNQQSWLFYFFPYKYLYWLLCSTLHLHISIILSSAPKLAHLLRALNMLGFLQSILSSLNPGPRRRHGYGNELKKRVRFDFEWRPLLENDEFVEKKSTKVKILMRKEAASRLLSKCHIGGRLEYEDVSRDLDTTPAAYVRVLSYDCKYEWMIRAIDV